MKRWVVFSAAVLLCLLVGIGLAYTLYRRWAYRDVQPVSFQRPEPATEVQPLPIVWEMLAQVDPDRALDDLRRLTGETPICIHSECTSIDNRLTGSQGLQSAKDYVYQNLTDLDYSVEVQDWSSSGYSDQNIIARKPGALHPYDKIYFVAHLDGKPFTPGADDNASGVADLLEVARVLNSYTFMRTLVLLFTTGEEQEGFGVASYLNQLTPAELSAIQYAVNVDMVGYDANSDGAMELWHAGHPPSQALTQIMYATILAYQLDLRPGFVVGCG